MMLSTLQFLKECLSLHFGQNIDKAFSASSYAFLTCAIVNWADRVLRRSSLRFLNRFLISTLVTPLFVDFLFKQRHPMSCFFLVMILSRIFIIFLLSHQMILEIYLHSLVDSVYLGCHVSFPV